MIGWLEASNTPSIQEYFYRTYVIREPSCLALHMIRIEQRAISRQQHRRVETAEKTAEKKSLGAVGLEPQDRSCSRRGRSAESGVEGKSFVCVNAWFGFGERGHKAKDQINTKAFLSNCSGV